MSQRAATIESLPLAFEMVKAMQAEGLVWDEDYRPLARAALAETARCHHPNPAEAQWRWRGRGASRSGSESVTTMHALFKPEVERKMTSAGRIIFCAHAGVRVPPPRHIEQPRRDGARTSAPATSAEILAAAAYPQRRSSHANSLRCAVSAKSPKILPATRADSDPNGFRGASPPTPATQFGLCVGGDVAADGTRVPTFTRSLSARPSLVPSGFWWRLRHNTAPLGLRT